VLFIIMHFYYKNDRYDNQNHKNITSVRHAYNIYHKVVNFFFFQRENERKRPSPSYHTLTVAVINGQFKNKYIILYTHKSTCPVPRVHNVTFNNNIITI
jgi:hypothetical protein